MCLCIYISRYLGIYVSMYVCMYISIYLYLYISLSLSLYTCVYIYIYTHIYLYIYISIHTWPPLGCLAGLPGARKLLRPFNTRSREEARQNKETNSSNENTTPGSLIFHVQFEQRFRHSTFFK